MGAPRRIFAWGLLPALVLGAVLAIVVVRAQPVYAHALLVSADPPVNSQVREPPAVLTLHFSESLEHKFSAIRVTDQTGARVDDEVTFDASDDTVMRVSLKPLSPGYITVAWENVSAVDGHRLSGTYPVTILNPDGSAPAAAPPSATSSVAGEEARPTRVVTKIFLLVGGTLLTGTFAFFAWVTPALPGADGEAARRAVARKARYVFGVAVIILLVFGVIELLLQAHDVGSSVTEVVSTRWGQRWLYRLILLLPLALASFAVVRDESPGRATSVVGLVLAGVYLAVVSSTSHAAAGAGSFWSAGSDFIHLLGASVWLGMLALLAVLLFWARNGLTGANRYLVVTTALRRFSLVAVVSLALILFTGVVNGVIEVARLSDLTSTAYGRALLIKLILIVPLILAGGANAYIYRPRYELWTEGSYLGRLDVLQDLEASLRKTIRIELALALAVLAVVAVLVQITPTRGTTPVQSSGKYTASGQDGPIAATLVVDPNEAGINSFEVYLTGAVDTVDVVRLNFIPNNDTSQQARLILDASNPPTFFVGKGPLLAKAGNWKIQVDILRTQGNNDLLIPFDVKVPNPGGQVQTVRGGSLSAPVHFTTGSIALLAGSAIVTLAIVLGSLPRPELPSGYLGLIADDLVERVTLREMRPVWSLAALVVVGVGLGLILGSHVHGRLTKDQAASQDNPIPASAESIDRGKMLFLQNCTMCHGESGRGDGPLAKTLPIPPANLYDHVPYHPDQFFFNVITNGLGGVMPAFGQQISSDDRWNILNYLRDAFGNPPPTQ